MSVRPSLAIVCGINDALPKNDPRFVEPKDSQFDIYEVDFTENKQFQELFDGGSKWVDDLWIDGNPLAPGLLPVVGYVVEFNSGGLARWLALAMDWKKDTIIVLQPGQIPNEFEQRYCEAIFGRDEVELANRENRWYDLFTPVMTNSYFERAIFLLHFAGWTGVTRDMLKMMVVLYWS